MEIVLSTGKLRLQRISLVSVDHSSQNINEECVFIAFQNVIAMKDLKFGVVTQTRAGGVLIATMHNIEYELISW